MVKSLGYIGRNNMSPRVLGFDDAPFPTRPRSPGGSVHAVGIVTTEHRFEGMLYVSDIRQDGTNAQQCLIDSVKRSKFHAQIHAVLLDGVTMGGLNVIDIEYVAHMLQRPVIAVMRSHPNLSRMLGAIDKLPGKDERVRRIRNAGPVHQVRDWIFQFRCPPRKEGTQEQEEGEEEEEQGVTAEDVARILDMCTPGDGQKIPECLRMAHLVGAAVKTGQSSCNA